jgi:hypothetical protein
VTRRRLLTPPALLAVAVAMVGCGSDDSGETTAPALAIPAITAPPITTSTQPRTGTDTGTAPSTTATTKGGKTYNPNAPDSPTNDIPPAKGSPQAAFEKQCKQNPSACG